VCVEGHRGCCSSMQCTHTLLDGMNLSLQWMFFDGDIALSLARFIDFLPFFLLVALFLYVLVFFIIYFVIIVVTNIRNVFRSSSATRSPCAAAAEKGQDGAHDDSGLGSRRHRSPSVLVGGRDVGVPIQRTVSQQGTVFRLTGSDFNGGNALPTRCEPHRNVVVVKRKRVWEIERVVPVPIGALLSISHTPRTYNYSAEPSRRRNPLGKIQRGCTLRSTASDWQMHMQCC